MAAVTAAASVEVSGARVAAAVPAEVTLTYTCSLPQYPPQQITAKVTWDAPTSVMVDQRTPAVTVTAIAEIPPLVTWALGFTDAKTVEGWAEGPGFVDAPQGKIDSALQLNVPPTPIPASDQDPIIVEATGTTPPLVFHQPGRATVTIGNGFDAHVILRDASGNPTGPDGGELHPTCTLDPDQNASVYSFDIVSPAAVPTPTPTAETGPTTSPSERPDGTGPPETITRGPSDPPFSPTGSTAPSTTTSATAPITMVPPTPTPDPPPLIPVALWTYGGWLVAAIVTAGVGVIGGVRWINRRRG